MTKVTFEQSQTKINLARAFAGECQDGARYQFLATQSVDEGYYYLQTLLKTLAKNEMAHAKKFYQLICDNSTKKQHNIKIEAGYPFECGNVIESLKDSLQTEDSQASNVYPSFAKIATDEGFDEIAKQFTFVSTIEKCHKMLLEQIIEKIDNKKLYKNNTPKKWKCSNCGFEHTDKTCWCKCPSCDCEQGYAEISIDTGE